jgi:hypothetical protein
MSDNKSTLELTIKGRNFAQRSADKTDPQCIVYSKTLSDKKYSEIGRTEVIRGSRNPNWSIKVPIAYRFNELQALKLEVWDYDICADNELLGEMRLLLGSLVASKTQLIKKRLKFKLEEEARETVTGELWLTIDEVIASKQSVQIQFEAKNLARKDFLGSSDPYLTLSKENIDGSLTQVYKSEVIQNTLDPIWPQFSLRVEDLCDSDYHKLLKIECFDWDRHTNDDFIGSVTTSLQNLSAHFPQNNVFELTNSLNRKYVDVRSKRKSMRNNFGFLLLKNLEIKQIPTFFDYIRGGTQIHFMTAIDFTQDSQSFHYFDRNDGKANNIEFVIRSLGDIIQCYDYQGLYGGFGFGAKLMPRYELSHCFNLNINSIVPYCDGVNEIISSYRSVMRSIEFDNPRNFASVINHVLQLTKNFQDGKHYFVLTVITSGCNSDNADTLDAIVKASAMPLSIIFVGIGNSAFSSLKRLSGDSTCSRGWRTYRDNVQV